MKKVCGLVLGAGTTAQYIGLGFVPDEVVLRKISAEVERLYWNRHMIRAATMAEGVLHDGNDDEDYDVTVLTDGNGIEAYYGGDLVATASLNQIVAISHPALADTLGSDMREYAKVSAAPSRVLVTTDAATKCHLNAPFNTSYVGVGSRLLVKPDTGGPVREFAITALSNDGDAVDDITLNNAITAGSLEFLSYKQDFAQLPAGYTMPQGIKINEVAKFNYAAAVYVLEAIQW